MKFERNRLYLAALLVLCAVALAAFVAGAPAGSGDAKLSVQLNPLDRWRLGFHRIEVCQGVPWDAVGWRFNVGPFSVSRLRQWQASIPTNIVMNGTNLFVLTNNVVNGTNFLVLTNKVLK